MVTKTRALQVRLTKDQHLQLQQLATQRGFSSLASYMRHSGLHHDFRLLDTVTELQRRIGALDAAVHALRADLVPDAPPLRPGDPTSQRRRRAPRPEEERA